jgi:hypothetical protein
LKNNRHYNYFELEGGLSADSGVAIPTQFLPFGGPNDPQSLCKVDRVCTKRERRGRRVKGVGRVVQVWGSDGQLYCFSVAGDTRSGVLEAGAQVSELILYI